MSFLRYYGGDSPDRAAPGRVYGRIDSQDQPGEGAGRRRVRLIDSVDADWFDERGREIIWFGAPDTSDELDWNVSVVEADVERPGGLVPQLARWLRSRRRRRWLEITFSPGGTLAPGEGVAHYLNLFEPPLFRGLTGWGPVPPDVEAQLERAIGLDGLPDAPDQQILEILDRTPAADAVAIYDVGQGACAALIASDRPSLYFDLGGGTLANARTFPAALRRFCVTGHPPVVLSHWDWDHWSSARRDTQALGLTWVVPRQDIGAVHTVFVGQILSAGGTVLVWPAGLPALDVSHLRIEACIGSPRSRNNSGLAMIVRDGDRSQILLPGDCRYDNVPSARGRFTSIAVPHHGGRTRSTFVPSSDGRSAGRCVYSAGAGNQWNHPYQSVLDEHAGIYAAELSTADRDPSGLGHVHLYWQDGQRDANPGCGASQCDLGCHQR